MASETREPGGPFRCYGCGFVHYGACREKKKPRLVSTAMRPLGIEKQQAGPVRDEHYPWGP